MFFNLGPTTAGRMDGYVNLFQSKGASLVMLAKGNRSKEVCHDDIISFVLTPYARVHPLLFSITSNDLLIFFPFFRHFSCANYLGH